MPRVRIDGGLIGLTNTPTTASASGMWAMKEHEKFIRSSSWPAASVPAGSVNAIALIVAGGGGGGAGANSTYNGGGGGAGGLYYNSNLPLVTTTNYTITIGAGGSYVPLANGTNGSNSSIVGVNSYYAIGGGGGGTTGSGLSGGSGGGGGGISASSTSGGASIQNSTYYYGVGFSGGAGNTGYSAAGGGGAGAAGTSGTASGAAGAGGVGLAYNFANGTSVYYAGGGGGSGGGSTSGSGGNGGGGAGAGTGVGASGYNGSIGTGGGGGGAWYGSAGNGGSGTVILSYPLPQNWTGGIVTNNNGANVVHTFNTSSTLTALSTPIDTYFNYNTLLLHGDGTSGSNNSVFLDSSSNTYIPFDGTYSNYFNGSTTYLSTTLTGNTPGTGSVTYECWFHTISAAATQILMNSRSGNTTDGVDIQIRSGKIAVTYTNTILYTGTATINANTWYHLAVVRNGASNWSVYINGVLDGTFVSSVNITSTTFTNGATPTQSGLFNGYISNCRVTNSAVYTSAPFTVPTAPLGAINNTVYLSSQSSSIKDNSVNRYTITNNGGVVISAGGIAVAKTGTPTQGTFSPFATTGWSNYFNGSSYISTPYNTSFSLTGDFTIELWVNYSAHGAYGGLITCATSGAGWSGWQIIFNNTNNSLLVEVNNTTLMTSSVDLTANVWNHIAWVRSGSTNTLYFNGVSVATASSSATFNSSTAPLYIGVERTPSAYTTGYISNVRILKGTALYTSTFTPPIASLTTSNANTALLTCANNYFVGSNTTVSNVTITTSGSPQVQPFSPFSPTAAYSNTVVGGGVYFSSGNYLTAPDNAAFKLGSNNFTIECWIYPLSAPTEYDIVSKWNNGGVAGTNQWLLYAASGTPAFVASTDGSVAALTITGSALTLNTWTHIAVVRNGTTFSLYQNGVLANSGTLAGSLYGSETEVLGINYRRQSGGSPITVFNGYISNLRILNGTAVYTSNFTPSTTPLTAVTNTSFLLNSTNAGIIDSSQKNNLITYGSAAVSNTQSKFGNTSISFNGSTDYLTMSGTNPAFTFGTGDFTVEFWVYFNSVSGTQDIFDTRPSGTAATANYMAIELVSGSLHYYTNNANPAINGGALSAGQWYHVALCRSSSSTKMYVNGTQVGSTYSDSQSYVNGANRPAIGIDANALNTSYFNGYIDDLRVTKGYARYTSAFTPPTSAFLNQ